MTTYSFQCNFASTPVADFRSWVTAIDTALTTVGLVRTSDTGQYDLVSGALPANAYVPIGYLMYRFSDTLQATRPLFLKIEVGAHGYSNAPYGVPSLFITLGKGTNGGGVISGTPLLARKALGQAANSGQVSGTTNLFDGVASGGDGWVSLFPWLGLTNGQNGLNSYSSSGAGYFHIERINNGDAVVVCFTATGSSPNYGYLADYSVTNLIDAPNVAAINYASGAFSIGLVPVSAPGEVSGTYMGPSTSLAAGTVGPVFPWIVIAPGLPPTQCVNIMTYPGGDAPASVFTTTLNGAERTYFPIPLSDRHNCFGFGISNINQRLSRYYGAAIRWE